MKLAFSTIINGSTEAYPGRIATAIHIGGGPFCPPYLPKAECTTPTQSEDTSFFVDMVASQAREDAETTAVVINGVEPLWQGNPVAELCKQLHSLGFFVKIETSGFYPSDVYALLPYVNQVSLDFKHKLDERLYSPLLGSKVSFEIVYANFMRTIAFLERAKVFKEVKTTVIPGVNDSPEVFDFIGRTCAGFADQVTLHQFVPFPKPLGDQSYEKISPPTRNHLLNLAQLVRKHVGRVVVKCLDSPEQEALPRVEADSDGSRSRAADSNSSQAVK